MHCSTRLLATTSALAMLVGCAAPTGVGSSTSRDSVRPFALQSNAPSPSPWQDEDQIYWQPLLGPDGSSIWEVGQDPYNHNNAAWRIDIPTGTVQEFPLQVPTSTGHAGPDGDVWFCGQKVIGKIDRSGSATYFPEPISDCSGITTGPDGNIWLTDQASIDRVTTSGQLSSFSIPGVQLGAIASSTKDGLLWFEYYKAQGLFGLGTFDPVTQTYALFQYDSFNAGGGGGLNTGTDGNAYEIPSRDGRPDGEIIRISPRGVVTHFTHLPKSYANNTTENVDTLWLGGPNSHLYSWTIRGHVLVDKGGAPFGIDDPILGPDMNVWYLFGVYLQRLLTVTPQSATIAVGGRQAFSITETDCPTCAWSATSSSPGVAQAGRVSGGGFTVTGKSAGLATISVSDKRNNVVRVSVTVDAGATSMGRL